MSSDSSPPGGCGIKVAQYDGGLGPRSNATLTGSGFKNGCRPEDVESRNIYRDSETSGPGGSPALVIFSSTGIQCQVQLAHGSILPGYVEARIRCSDGRSWSEWKRVTKAAS